MRPIKSASISSTDRDSCSDTCTVPYAPERESGPDRDSGSICPENSNGCLTIFSKSCGRGLCACGSACNNRWLPGARGFLIGSSSLPSSSDMLLPLEPSTIKKCTKNGSSSTIPASRVFRAAILFCVSHCSRGCCRSDHALSQKAATWDCLNRLRILVE